MSNSCPTSRMRHSLLQPTAAIQLILDSARREGTPPEIQSEAMRTAAKAAGELESELRLLTTFLLLEHGIQSPELSDTSLHDLTTEAMSEDPIIHSEMSRVHQTIPTHMTIQTDSTLLRNAVHALVLNAVEFSKGDITISASELGPQIIIEIRDHGIGISDNAIQKIGAPFFVENAVKTNRPSRLGLGLSIASKSIRKLSGHLHLQKDSPCGTTASIFLPRPI